MTADDPSLYCYACNTVHPVSLHADTSETEPEESK